MSNLGFPNFEISCHLLYDRKWEQNLQNGDIGKYNNLTDVLTILQAIKNKKNIFKVNLKAWEYIFPPAAVFFLFLFFLWIFLDVLLFSPNSTVHLPC